MEASDKQSDHCDPHWLGVEFAKVPSDRPYLVYRIMADKDVHPDDLVVDDEFDMDLGPYPALTMGANCAKNYDTAVLKDCTEERMRIIADRYEGVNPKERTMSVLFKALFDAMSDNQQCDTCPSGDCDPLTHRLPPSSLPPLDFVLGEDGMCRPAYDPQQTTGTDNQTQSTSQQPTGITPSSSLYRPSGVNDVEVRQNTTPLVDGVQQQQQAPPNVPALVQQGAAGFMLQPPAVTSTDTLKAKFDELAHIARKRRKKEEEEIASAQTA